MESHTPELSRMSLREPDSPKRPCLLADAVWSHCHSLLFKPGREKLCKVMEVMRNWTRQFVSRKLRSHHKEEQSNHTDVTMFVSPGCPAAVNGTWSGCSGRRAELNNLDQKEDLLWLGSEDGNVLDLKATRSLSSCSRTRSYCCNVWDLERPAGTDNL